MRYIWATEKELNFCEKGEIPDNAEVLGLYTKEKFLELVHDFPELVNPLKLYRFLYWDGTIHETYDLGQFARDHKLTQSNLYNIHNHPRFSYKGLIKCPDNATSDKTHNKQLHKQITEFKRTLCY